MVSSRRFLGLISSLIIGIGLANFVERWTWSDVNWLIVVPLWIAIGLALLIVAHWFPFRFIAIFIGGSLALLTGFLWGRIYLGWTAPGPIVYATPIQIFGTVVSFPEISGRWQRFVVVSEDFGRKDHIQVITSREPQRQRGERLKLVGSLRRPENKPEFPTADVLRGQGIFTSLNFPKSVTTVSPPPLYWRLINRVRERITATMTAALPEPAASLALGLTIGIDPEIDRDFAFNLRRTNLTHLAAVSGQNITILILFLFRYLRRIAPRPAIGLSLGWLVFYTVITGAAASIVRAAIMTSIVFLALLFGRPSNSLRSLLIAAAVISLADPRIVLGDIGFALSFFAMAGILLFSPTFERWLKGLPLAFRQLVGMTTAATIAVAPLQIVTFGTISTVGILANLLVGPMIFLAMAGGFLIGLVGFIQPALSQMLGLILYPIYELIHWVANWLGSSPLAQVNLAVSPAVKLILMGSSLFILVFLFWRRLRQPGFETSILD